MMKKMIMLVYLLVLALIPSIGMAATVGNVADTQGGGGKFSLGVEYDSIFDRDLKFKSGTVSLTVLGVTVSEPFLDPGASFKDVKLESNRIFLKGTVGVHPNIDLFAKLGMADGKWEGKYVSPGDPDEKNEFDGDYDFAWGIGAKAKLFQSPGDLKVMLGGQYLSYEVDGKFKIDGEDLAEALRREFGFATVSYDSKTKIQEWQVALYVNQTFGRLSPYGGIKYSDVEVKNETSGNVTADGIPFSAKLDLKTEADKNFGIFLGADIFLIPNRLSLNIEGRFLDETAGTIGMNYRF